MKELNENYAQIKLDMIGDIIKMSSPEIDRKILSKDRFNFELTEKQAQCMKAKACKIIFGNITDTMSDFEITANSFKTMRIGFDYLHFHFIDKISLSQDFGMSINDFGHDLYYIIIVCDQKGDLLHFNFDDPNSYDMFIVDRNFEVQEITSFDKIKYKNIRKNFLSGVGDRIRKNSTLNSVTEYITFPREHVEEFRNAVALDTTIKVRIVSICLDCDIDLLSTIQVSNYLRDSRNQQKLSLAFQKFVKGQDTDFYDIGNMQP